MHLWLLLDSNTTLVIKLMCQHAVLTDYVTRPFILPPKSKMERSGKVRLTQAIFWITLCVPLYNELYCYHYLLVVQVVEETELQFLLSTAACTLRNQLAVNMTCKYSDTFLNDHLPNCNHLYNLNTTCSSMNYHWWNCLLC